MSKPDPPVHPDLIADYLRLFPSKIRRRGKQYYRDRAVQRIEVFEPGTHYVVYVEGTELYEVDVLWDVDDWYVDCNCPYEGECKHAYAAMQSLLEIASGKTSVSKNRAPSKSSTAPPPPARPSVLRETFERVKGKPASKREAAYLKQVTDLYESLRPNKADPQVARLEKLGVSSPLRTWGSVRIWLEFPEHDLEFWLYALNHHQGSDRLSPSFGRDIPDFMDHVSDLSPIADKLKRMSRAREIDGWRDFFSADRALILADGEATQRQENELRLCLKPEFAALEIRRPGAADFRILSLADFKALTDRYKPSRLPFDTRSELLLRRMDHKAYLGNSHRLRREDHEDMRALHSILSSPTLRGAVVNSSGDPFDWPAEKLIWNVRKDEQDGNAYRAEITFESGEPVSDISFALSGSPGFYVVGSSIHEGPPFDPGRLNPKKGATLPREAVEQAVGLEYFHRVGARIPEELASRIEDVELGLRITCRLRRDYNEQCELIAQAADEAGAVVETWRNDEWQTELRALPEIAPGETPDPSERVRVLKRSALSVVPGIFDAIGAGFNWQNGLGVQVTRNFPKRFSEWLESLPEEVEVVLEGELAAFNQPATAGRLSLNIEESGIDWFDLKVELDIDANDLTDEEIELLLNAKGDWVRLDDKGWRRLAFELSEEEDEQLARLGLNPRQMSAEPQRIHALQLAAPAAQEFLPEKQAEQLRSRVNEIQARVTPEVPAAVTAELRPYQVEGFHFLAYLSENRFGGILADDMGLGKTLQTLAWIAWLRDRGEAGPCLVVCPKSVMDNWQVETGRFTPGLKARIWHRAEAKELPERADEADIHVINYAALPLSIRHDGGDGMAVLWQDGAGALNVSRYDCGDAFWTHLGPVIGNAHTTHAAIQPLPDPAGLAYLIVWVDGSEIGRLRRAFVGEDGAMMTAVREVGISDSGVHSRLTLNRLQGRRAMLRTQFQTDTASLREYFVGFPEAGDCNGNGIPDATEIAGGAAHDRNGNGIPDRCEIADGLLADRDRNGVPDDFEDAQPGDLNRNGFADINEIFAGILADGNGNALPDEYELFRRTLPRDLNKPAQFYRAPRIIIRAIRAGDIDLDVQGTKLEKADSVTGPWVIVE